MRCILTLLFFALGSGMTAAQTRAPADHSAMARQLVSHGYHPAVASRLVTGRPDVATAIVRLAAQGRRLPEEARDGWRFAQPGQLAHEPVRAYRGIDLERFDPARRFRFRSHPGYEFHWTSTDLSGMVVMRAAWGYTGGKAPSTQRYGVVLEMEFPRFLLMSSEHPRFAIPNTTPSRGYPVPIQLLVPDIAPYLLRVGEVPFDGRAYELADTAESPSLIQWQAPEAAEHYFDLGAYHESLRLAADDVTTDPAIWLGL